MSTPKESEMVEREPTKEQCIYGLEASLQVARRNGRGDEVKCYKAAIAFLRAPALVLSEGEREALQAGALALVVDAHDWRKLVLDLPEDKPDCARWIARSDQSENHAATLRAIASRGKL